MREKRIYRQEEEVRDNQEEAADSAARNRMLFVTKTCPNCMMATTVLQNADIAFEKIYAEDHPELAQKFDIRHAPTLIVLGDKEGEI